jgi:hypothetical protein
MGSLPAVVAKLHALDVVIGSTLCSKLPAVTAFMPANSHSLCKLPLAAHPAPMQWSSEANGHWKLKDSICVPALQLEDRVSDSASRVDDNGLPCRHASPSENKKHIRSMQNYPRAQMDAM